MGTVSKMYMNVFNSIMARSMDYSWKANKMLAHVLPLRFPLVQKNVTINDSTNNKFALKSIALTFAVDS